MTPIRVSAAGWLTARGRHMRCALGRGGIDPAKTEGDGVTPAGIWYPEAVLYRSGRAHPPQTRLPLTPIGRHDGWCDAPDEKAYNQPVHYPYRASAEHLWRRDGLYDLVVVLDHNRHPARPHHGSAIFIHVCRPDFGPTEGCIALPLPDLRWLIGIMTVDSAIRVGI